MTGEPGPGVRDFRLMVAPEPFDPAAVEPSHQEVSRREPARQEPPSSESLSSESSHRERLAATPAARATVVQFAALLSEPDIARLKAAYGLRLDKFIPNLAYLERLDTATADRVRADFLVRAVIPFPQASKLSPTIPATGPLDLTMVLFEDSDPVAVTASLTALGARDMATADDRESGGRLRLHLTLDDPSRVAQAAAIDDVIWIEPEPEFTLMDAGSARVLQSGDPSSGPVWIHNLHGEEQVIGMIDQGGVDLDHCFFADNPPNKPGPDHRKVVRAFNEGVVGRHFMQMAGIIAGDQLGFSGNHPNRGGAWAAKLVTRSLGDLKREKINTGFAVFSLETLLNASRKEGASIHNLSWGIGKVAAYDVLAQDADKFSFEHEDQLLVAAGQNREQGTENLPPGIAFNTLCVAATKAFPDHMSRGNGVDGPTPDGRRKPDLMAVGCGITTAAIPTPSPKGPFCDVEVIACGCSAATANTSAAAALVRQYFQRGFYPAGEPRKDKVIKQPSGALIKAVLLNSTVRMTDHPGYPNDITGWGIIQLDRTLFFKDTSRRGLIVKDVPKSAGLRMGETRTSQFFVNGDTEPLKITLVWVNRPPSEQNLPHPRVDAIRFEVEDSQGNFYMGNDLDGINGVSRKLATAPASPPDAINNVQMVIVNQPTPGTWRIRLRQSGHQEKQRYALVVSGDVAVDEL
ncbi:S8 family serine peptidase [Nonomuraea sp. NPDC050022]|uniref:S8 family serine peptidase n=1 Tax=Nonomuraea sp. NPDC050022 TaxID=3364358 RepID=UPI0037A531F6